jgi:enoyl-CoA hydratase/carnithine racemase
MSQMNPASSRAIATTVRLMGLPRAVSRCNRRHSVPGAVDDGLGQAFEAGLDLRTYAGGMAVTPLGFDH